ncbi:MAG: lactate racemase domain-containing protein [Thermoleophilia bacterium]
MSETGEASSEADEVSSEADEVSSEADEASSELRAPLAPVSLVNGLGLGSFRFAPEKGRLDIAFPLVRRVRQRFAAPREPDVCAAVAREMRRLDGRLAPGARVAVGLGSRGLAELPRLARAVVEELRVRGARPFVVPAMGSHGGATAEGQLEVLAGYGVTPETLGVEFDADMEVELLGHVSLPDGGTTPVYFSRAALRADAVLAVNRVKPHTSFHGPVESGLSKMLAIGFGKHLGAAGLHRRGTEAFAVVVPAAARLILDKVPVLGGLATVENAFEQVARVEFVPGPDIPAREPELLELSRRLMPRIPFRRPDVLVVDYLGKDISGDGMDPNVTGRHGNPRLADPERNPEKIVVLRLTERTHGNVCGLGLADVTTRAVVDRIDLQATWTNVVTSLELDFGKIPLWMPDDREAIALALSACPGLEPERARLVRVHSTLHLEELWVSEALWRAEGVGRADLEPLGEPEPMAFTAAGRLADLP